MGSRARYRMDRVTLEPGEQRAATWTFAGEAVAGVEQSYTVIDGNFPSRNVWDFVIRIPKGRGERVEVRPRATPGVKVWAELTDRSLTFSRATKGSARGKWYCTVALADPTGEKSRDVVRGDQRHQLPAWFESVQSRMRLKATVRTTRGTDGNTLAVLLAPDDHELMVRLFFAMKVWVLKERFTLS